MEVKFVIIFQLKCFKHEIYTLPASRFFFGIMLTICLPTVLFKHLNFQTTKIFRKAVKQDDLIVKYDNWNRIVKY